MSTAKLRKASTRRATAGGPCAGSGPWTGPGTWTALQASASDSAAFPEPRGEPLGDDAVAFRVRMDRVGFQVRVAQHLADHAFLVGQAELFCDAGVELRRAHAEARLRRADQHHLDAAVFRQLHHLADV